MRVPILAPDQKMPCSLLTVRERWGGSDLLGYLQWRGPGSPRPGHGGEWHSVEESHENPGSEGQVDMAPGTQREEQGDQGRQEHWHSEHSLEAMSGGQPGRGNLKARSWACHLLIVSYLSRRVAPVVGSSHQALLRLAPVKLSLRHHDPLIARPSLGTDSGVRVIMMVHSHHGDQGYAQVDSDTCEQYN